MMTRAQALAASQSRLRGFAADRDGVAAVEFAIILPVMLTLYLGCVELGDGWAANFKTTLAARTVANLASEYTSIDSPTMSAILGAASTVMAPYTSSPVVVVSEISTNASGQGTVTWSAASSNGTARTQGSSVSLPSQMQTANVKMILGEVTYPYTPALGYVITGTINLYQTEYFFPRMSTCVTYNSQC